MTRLLLALACLTPLPALAQPLPNTQPLERQGDIAAQMVAGIDRYLMQKLDESITTRSKLTPDRQRLAKVLGIVDPRIPFTDIEYVGGPNSPALIAESPDFRVYTVRWPVLPGVDGEGLLIEPKGKVVASAVAIPDVDATPEQAVGLVNGVLPDQQVARLLGERGTRVLVPTLINRESSLSTNPRIGRAANIPHREFIYRMAFEMGRSLIGLEVQKVLAAVDWLAAQKEPGPIGISGRGDGGRIALYAGALDERVAFCGVHYAFGPRERSFEEPLDRNIWGLLKEFGDAEVAELYGKRELIVGPTTGEIAASHWPRWIDPAILAKGPRQGAPGEVRPLDLDAVSKERHRRQRQDDYQGDGVNAFITALTKKEANQAPTLLKTLVADWKPLQRQPRQFQQLVGYIQKLWRDSDLTRKQFWSKADRSSVAAWQKSTETYRTTFWEEVIGKLPKPDAPLNPRSRQVYDEPKWTGYEVTLDLYPNVFAYGILLLPKGMKPGEKRPVVVCQHGLEGRPTDIVNPKERTKYYNSFGAQLADRGYIVFAPQNPYIGRDDFRVLQRKANPLGWSLFSFIIRQHEVILDWLTTLPNVDPERMAFYGLSYGGKTAMRVPAVLPRYCLSICSGDFNEWIGKNVSVDLPMGYMFTFEYEMYEYNLGNTFNYAEMAYLIAPRPFMVERGHDDGVGIDEMIAWEFAKVRYLYANQLKVPDRTMIEWFVGGHEINGKGTFEFLDRHLNWGK